MRVEETNVLNCIEAEIMKFIEIYVAQIKAASSDGIYRGEMITRLKNELEMYIHRKFTELINIYAKGSDEALINELCRYILHKSSPTPIEPQGVENHKTR